VGWYVGDQYLRSIVVEELQFVSEIEKVFGEVGIPS